MGKMEYLDALKRAMTGLPPEIQARTLAYYEQRFVDGVAAGRSEEDVGKELDDPKKIALTLRASTHLSAFNEKKNPANLLRLLVSAVGLAIFNLFMVVPAAVFGSLLIALYATGIAIYFGGIAVTAAGLAGANEIVFSEAPYHVVIDEDGARRREQTRVTIGPGGIHVRTETAPEPGAGNEAGTQVVVEGPVQFSADPALGSREAQTMVGLAMVAGGIVLFLLSLVVTRYTFIGIRRYLQMNLSLLKGA